METDSASPELDALTGFAAETRWDNLSDLVVHETKRILLDSLGCAFTGLSLDPGKMAVSLARRIGGPPEASIIGIGGKVSMSAAILANGQLINAADYDGFVGGPHSPPFVIPAPLATAEFARASGKDLITALALAFEIESRVYRAVANPEFAMKEREGFAAFNFGSAAGAAKLLGLNKEQMRNAISLSGHFAQVLPETSFSYAKRGKYTKYGLPGWQGTGAIAAVLLAQMGYTGDSEIFDSKYGFWKFAGYGSWEPGAITEKLGEEWTFYSDKFWGKYPNHYKFKTQICCGIIESAVVEFQEIVEKNSLLPGDIASVKVYTPRGPDWISLFRSKEIANVIDAQFSIPYCISVAAHRVRIGIEWQDLDTMKDQKIVDFMDKVTVIQGYGDWKVGRPFYETGLLNRVEVTAKGKTFAAEKAAAMAGLAAVPDKTLEEKFRHNVSRTLTKDKIERATNALWNLEKIDDITELMKCVSL